MAGINDKYLSGAGLRTFVDYLNSTWWSSRKNELQDTYLPLAGGTIIGQLNINSDAVTQDILPKTTDSYSLGSLGTGNGDARVWAGVYATRIVTENLTVTGSMAGTSDSAKKTDGSLSFGTYDEAEVNNSAEIFSFDGSKNTFIRTDRGIGIVTSELENTYLLGHTNDISTGSNSENTLSFGDQIYVPKLTFDDHGHASEEAWAIYTLPTLPSIEASGNLSITTDAASDKIIISTTATTDDAITSENVGMSIKDYLGITASELN